MTLLVFVFTAALSFITACGRDVGQSQPLFAEGARPLVLTEVSEVALPPNAGGNRFLAGWWPRKSKQGLWLLPGPEGAAIEVVDLGLNRRRLVLEGRVGEPFSLDVFVDDDLVERVLMTGRTEVELPRPLKLGRSVISFRPVPDSHPALESIHVLPASRPGTAEWEGGKLVQTGNSLVQIVVPLHGSSTLTGRVELPEPGPGATTEAAVLWEPAIGEYRWAGEWRAGLGGDRKRISARIEAEGFVRLSFLVTGEGAPVIWERLALERSPTREDRRVPEEAEPAGLGDPLRPSRLVLVYVMDALRADVVGYHGAVREATPTLDKLASEGVVFLSHRSNAPNTLPSTKTLFVGHVWRQGGGWKLESDRETLAERWRSQGYRTGLFSGNVYVTPSYGMDRGFEHVGSEALWSPPLDDDGGHVNDNASIVHAALLEWLDEMDPSERAFAYVHTIHPHNPYEPPPPFPERFTAGIPSTIDGSTRVLLDVRQRRREVSSADRQRLAALYTANLAYNDAQLELLLDHLHERYGPGEVLVVVTSDHGEELFDHDGVLHGYTLYQEQLSVPLLFWWPGRIRPGGRVTAMTSTVDLHETLLALARGERGPLLTLAAVRDDDRDRRESRCEGEGSGSIDRSEPPAIHYAAASNLKGGIYSASTRRWKLVWAPRTGPGWGMGEGRGRTRAPEYLFDLCSDPGETRNRAGEGDLEVEWLRQRLLAWIEEPEANGGEATLTPDDEERLRALGYLD